MRGDTGVSKYEEQLRQHFGPNVEIVWDIDEVKVSLLPIFFLFLIICFRMLMIERLGLLFSPRQQLDVCLDLACWERPKPGLHCRPCSMTELLDWLKMLARTSLFVSMSLCRIRCELFRVSISISDP